MYRLNMTYSEVGQYISGIDNEDLTKILNGTKNVWHFKDWGILYNIISQGINTSLWQWKKIKNSRV